MHDDPAARRAARRPVVTALLLAAAAALGHLVGPEVAPLVEVVAKLFGL